MTSDAMSSSDDDSVQETSASHLEADVTEETSRPWWAGDPTLAAKRDEVYRWLEEAEAEPEATPDDTFAAIDREISTGACRRELRRARQDLDRARVRYADAVRAARAVGYSWGEIGHQLGVSRQALHRRFRHEID